MKRNVLFGLGVIVALYVVFVASLALSQQNPTAKAETANQTAVNGSQPPTREELLKLVNAERAKAGVAPLKEDARLDASAQYKASDMFARNYYSHSDPVTGKKNGLDYANNTGIKCSWVSENIEENSTAIQAVKAWVNSPAHYKAMTSTKYTLTGFGVSRQEKTDYYLLVEHFCAQ